MTETSFAVATAAFILTLLIFFAAVVLPPRMARCWRCWRGHDDIVDGGRLTGTVLCLRCGRRSGGWGWT